MPISLTPLCDADGSWNSLNSEWRKQCIESGEDFDNYAVGTFSVLHPLAKITDPKAQIYGLDRDGGIAAICQINKTKLPDYDGHVLRVRMMTLAPKYDFGPEPPASYVKIISSMFVGAVNLSVKKLAAPHLKFHLRSPADAPIFDAISTSLGKHPAFKKIELKGMWLYVTKSK